MSSELWLPVPGWEGLYEVSSKGEVRSLDRLVRNRWGSEFIRRGRVLRASPDPVYLRVALYPRQGERREFKVHVLVLLAFEGPCPEGWQARHLNGDPRDNRRSNLAWGTVSQNNLDRVSHGTHQDSVKTHCPQRHPYSPENTYVTPGGSRHCRICKRAALKRFRARQQEVSP